MKNTFKMNQWSKFGKPKTLNVDEIEAYVKKHTLEVKAVILKKGYTLDTIPSKMLIDLVNKMILDKPEKNYAKFGYGKTFKKEKLDTESVVENVSKSIVSKYYDILKIKPTENFEEVKNAYRKLMKIYHPDKFTTDSDKNKATEYSSKLNEVYTYFEKKLKK